MQTPIFSQISREYVSIDVEETPTEVICTYALEKVEDNTGGRIKDLQLGYHLGLEYKLVEKLSCSINFTQHLSSLINNPTSSFQTSNSVEKFLPMRISGGLNLYLGKGGRKKNTPALY